MSKASPAHPILILSIHFFIPLPQGWAGCFFFFFPNNIINRPVYADTEIMTKIMTIIIIINNKVWLYDIFNALVCNVSKTQDTKLILTQAKFPGLPIPSSLGLYWKLIAFLCTRQDFSFAQRMEFQGLLANFRT